MIFTVARDPEGNLGLFIGFTPVRITMKFSDGVEQSGWTSPDDIDDYEVIELPSDMFPDLKWEDDPLEVRLVDKKNYNERYKRIVESKSFKETYGNKSLGENESEEEPIDLISELKEYLSNTSEDQKKKDWEEIKSLFPEDETIKKQIDYPDYWEGIDPELKTLWENENFPTETGDHMMYIDERLLIWIARKSMEYQRKLEYPLCETVNDKIAVYIEGHFITDAVVKTDVNSIVKAMREAVEFGKEEQLDGEIHEVVTKTFSNSQGTYLHVKEGLNMKDGSKLHILIFKENGNY